MNTDPRRMCELIVGLGDVEVLGVDDEAGKPLRIHVRCRALRPPCSGCGGVLRSDGDRLEVCLSLSRRWGVESNLSFGFFGVVESGLAVVVEPGLAGLL